MEPENNSAENHLAANAERKRILVHQGKNAPANHCTPAFKKVPQEVMDRIAKFCHHISLVYLHQTNHEFRSIAMKEMRNRMQKLTTGKKWQVQSSDAILNCWTLLTVKNSCAVCATCTIDGTRDVKWHDAVQCIICKACFMDRIHVERPKFSLDDISGAIRCDTMNGVSMKFNPEFDRYMTDLTDVDVQVRLCAYFMLLKIVWEDC